MKSFLMLLVACAVVWGQTIPVVTLVSPVHDEEWVVGSTHQIQWTGVNWADPGRTVPDLYQYRIRASFNYPARNWYPAVTVIDTTSTVSFTCGSFSRSWTVPDTLYDSLGITVSMRGQGGNPGSDKDTIKIIGRPKFTGATSVSVKAGDTLAYKAAYTLPGNPSRYTKKMISKPTWVTVDTVKDSIYGIAPAKNGTDTVKYEVKAFTKKVFVSRTQDPLTGRMDTTWTAIDSIAGTLKLAINISYTPPLPAVPVLTSPIDSASVSIAPTLLWSTAANAVTYRIQVSLNTGFTTTVVDDSTLATTSKSLTSLSRSTRYYWRVNAKGAGGTSAWSSVWNFLTEPPTGVSLAVSQQLRHSTSAVLLYDVCGRRILNVRNETAGLRVMRIGAGKFSRMVFVH
jgi:hypothetical protein